jgi:hypothetical protein
MIGVLKMKYPEDYGSEKWIAEVERLSGFTAENTGGNVYCFVFEVSPEKTLYFGYADEVFSVGDEEGNFYGKMSPENETPENEAKFIKAVLKEVAQ